MDAKDPEHLLAGTWQVEQHTWAQLSGGPGSGVYITHDGGAKWTKVDQRHAEVSASARSTSRSRRRTRKRMYALIQTADQGSLWRSDDAGATWKVVSWDRSLIGRAGYYIRMVVNPQNPDDVFIIEQQLPPLAGRRQDVQRQRRRPFAFTQGQASCGDCHDIWIDPKDPVRYVLTDDGGATSTRTTGTVSVSLPNGQMYHVHVDNRVPYWIYSNRQDDGTMRGPSTSSETDGQRLPARGQHRCRTPPRGFGRGRGRGGGGGGGGSAAAAPAAPAEDRRRARGPGPRARPRRPPRGSRTSAAASRASRFPIRPTPNIVYASLLRQQGDALGRAHRHRALDRAVDGLARLAAERSEVPLPLDGADGDRSVRSRTTCSTAAS